MSVRLHGPTPWLIEGLSSIMEHRVFDARGMYVGAFARKSDALLVVAAPKLADALLELLHHPGRASEESARAALAEAGIE